jgi:sortase B
MRLKAIPFVLALLLCFFVTGCNNRGNTPDELSSDAMSDYSTPSAFGQSESSVPAETSEAVINKFMGSDILTKQIAAKMEQNDETVGWLVVPNTNINDVVVCYTGDNDYYLRRNFNKEDDFDGVFYADFRSEFGDGSRDELGQNTCIYGHAMTDVETEEKYSVKFGELHNFRDPEFAAKTPYLLFSTEKETLIWEVFAVFMGNRNAFAYNRNDLESEEFYRVVTEDVLPRSIYNYDVELKEDDKFLTLSTCIYNLPDGSETGYPDTHFRYGVMARLVNPDETLKEAASFTENPDLLIDKDNYPN